MKLTLTVILFLLLSNMASAQIDSLCAYSINTIGKPVSRFPPVLNAHVTVRICAPSKVQLLHPAMTVIFANNKVIYKSDTLIKGNIFSSISPDAIETVNILNGPQAEKKYGGMAKNGVVEFYLKEGKYKDMFKSLKIDSAGKKRK